jgi:glycosyltransferase involved in cell wall biosynthesis
MVYDVTIGIPVYKSVDYIRRALESALSQTYSSVEFLIVDDAGCDGSMDVVEEIKREHPKGKDIHIITHSQNMGVSASRNRIIDEAQGQYLYFMDSDDVIAENVIELMMQNVRQYNAEIVFGSYEKIDVLGEKTIYQYPSLQLLNEDELACFAYRKYAGIQASACNYLVMTSLLKSKNLYYISTNYWEDLTFTFNLVTCISRAVLLPDLTYTYLCHEGSLSHYQERSVISKDEVLQNISSIDYLKKTSALLCDKVYYPNRCLNIMMTDFYIAANILKRRNDIVPSFSDREIKAALSHPATWRQIFTFRQSRMKNLLFYAIGKMPSALCVAIIWCLGKVKKII